MLPTETGKLEKARDPELGFDGRGVRNGFPGRRHNTGKGVGELKRTYV